MRRWQLNGRDIQCGIPAVVYRDVFETPDQPPENYHPIPMLIKVDEVL
jgi:hypothetical protein